MSLVQHAPPLAVATEAGTAGTHVTAHAPLADGAGDADDSPLGRAVRDYRDTTLRIEWLRGEIALAQEHAAAAANFIAMYQCYAADLYRSP